MRLDALLSTLVVASEALATLVDEAPTEKRKAELSAHLVTTVRRLTDELRERGGRSV